LPPTPRPTLFPYTTLFRSQAKCRMHFVRQVEQRYTAQAGLTLRIACVDIAGVRREVCPLGQPGVAKHIDAHITAPAARPRASLQDRKSTRLNSSHLGISYA